MPFFADLEDRLRASRGLGSVYVARSETALRPERSVSEQLEAFVVSLHFTGIGDCWRELPYDGAESLLAHIFCQDLAYGSVLMPREKALALIH